MRARNRLWRRVCGAGLAATLAAGCTARPVRLPAGHLPTAAPPADVCTTGVLTAAAVATPPAAGERKPFDLPRALPGADAAPLPPLNLAPGASPAQRDQRVRDVYPALPADRAGPPPAAGAPTSLADLQQLALVNSPAVRRARAEAEAAMGPVIQAGLRPNPTVGYQADQMQPGGRPTNNPGQQGFFINQAIKFPGKLSLAQAVAGFDYLNSLVAVRRAQVDAMTRVRTAYFAALVAQQSAAVNQAVADLADEMYRTQLRQVAAGQLAGYEPLQLYAQAVQARNAVVVAQTNLKVAWKQLAAAVGQADLPPAPLVGKAGVAPALDLGRARDAMLANHTDLLTARNAIRQAEVNLQLQRRTPYPDLATNTYVQYDTLAQTPQVGVQLGVQLPLFDRSQGHQHQARWTIARHTEELKARENDLQFQFADAAGRYDANRTVAENYSTKIIPNLTRAYRGLLQQYQVQPEKVGFNDILVAQQNLAQAMQAQLAALDAQWRALADLANLTQLDDLLPCEPAK